MINFPYQICIDTTEDALSVELLMQHLERIAYDPYFQLGCHVGAQGIIEKLQFALSCGLRSGSSGCGSAMQALSILRTSLCSVEKNILQSAICFRIPDNGNDSIYVDGNFMYSFEDEYTYATPDLSDYIF